MKKYLFTTILIVFFLLTGKASAAIDFGNESFENYSTGAVSGQNGWTGTSVISDTEFYDGGQSFSFTGNASKTYSVITGQDTVRFWWKKERAEDTGGNYAEYMRIYFTNGVDTEYQQINFRETVLNTQVPESAVWIDTHGYDLSIPEWFLADSWHYLDLQFNSTSKSYSYRTDWTQDYVVAGSFTTHDDMVFSGLVNTYQNCTGDFWVDNMGVDDENANLVNYQFNDYALNVIYPHLDSENKANVQPSANFKIKAKYLVPEDKKSQTRFVVKQCYNTDMTDCDFIATDTIENIENNLEYTDLLGYVIFEVPVVLDEWTLFYIELADDVNQDLILVSSIGLYGVDDPLLPSADGAISNTGGQEDLGVLGNTLRYLFTPTSDFMTNNLSTFIALRDEKFPAYSQIVSTVSSLEDSMSGGSSVAPSLPTFSLYGSQDMAILNTTPLDSYMPTIKNYIRLFLWFFCCIFAIKAVHSYFKPESNIVTNL